MNDGTPQGPPPDALKPRVDGEEETSLETSTKPDTVEIFAPAEVASDTRHEALGVLATPGLFSAEAKPEDKPDQKIEVDEANVEPPLTPTSKPKLEEQIPEKPHVNKHKSTETHHTEQPKEHQKPEAKPEEPILETSMPEKASPDEAPHTEKVPDKKVEKIVLEPAVEIKIDELVEKTADAYSIDYKATLSAKKLEDFDKKSAAERQKLVTDWLSRLEKEKNEKPLDEPIITTASHRRYLLTLPRNARITHLKLNDAKRKAAVEEFVKLEATKEVPITTEDVEEYRTELNDADKEAFDIDTPESDKTLTIKQWKKSKIDQQFEIDEETEPVVINDIDILRYSRTLKGLERKNFDALSDPVKEMLVAIELLAAQQAERIAQKEAEKLQTKSRPSAETSIKPEQHIKEPKKEKVERKLVESKHDKEIVIEFINSLNDLEYQKWSKLDQAERDAKVLDWFKEGKPNTQQAIIDLLSSGEVDKKSWDEADFEQKLKMLKEFMGSRGYQMQMYAHENSHPESNLASLHTYEYVTETVTRFNPETGKVEAVQEVNPDNGLLEDVKETILVNSVDRKRKLDKEYTEEQKEELIKERLSALPRKYRFMAWYAQWTYIVLNHIFDIERVLAEENKKQQELIRSIVDTGPDNNERWAFAIEGPDGVWRQIETGEVVPAAIAKHWRKKALENPSRFQALCHYELSKQPEHKQIETWEAIFSMMAEEGYDKYSMFGVVVGLQFMNKPQYLAVKNTKLRYAAIYEMDPNLHDEAGKHIEGPVRLTAENITEADKRDGFIVGDPKPIRYTGDMIFVTNAFGIKRRLRGADGKPVNIGDVVRDKYKIELDTTTIELQKFDQEYNETDADGKPKYELRTRTVNKIVDEVQPDGSIKKVSKEVTEEYRVKRVLNVKTKGYFHEIAGKFASYQYGFRSSDMAVTLDATRKALYDCVKIAQDYDITNPRSMPNEVFTTWQENQLALNRMYMAISASRMGGSPGEDGKGPQADAATMRQDIIRAEQQSGASRTRNGRAVYPPRISGTAEAIKIWEDLAEYVDIASRMFPSITQIRYSDFEAKQDLYTTRNEEGGLRRAA